MASLIRDTTFGYLIRYVFSPKVLPHPDEVNLPEVWRHAVVRRGKSPTPDEKVLSTSSPAGSEDHKDLSSTVPGGIVMQDGDATGGERGSDLMLVGWYGPDDEDNLQNWPRWKKIWVLFQTCLLTWAIYIGSSIYTAGLTDVQETFHVSEVAATLGLSLFVAGYAIGPMLWSPLSEVPQIGRLPIYISTLLAFVLFQIPTALAKNFGTLLAFRFLSGFFGSPILATGGATIAEVFRPTHRAYGLVVWAMFATMGPVLGPLLGGFAATAEGWTWTAWELAWLSGFTLVLLFFFFPETSAANIIYRRARRLRHATGNDTLRSQSELDVAGTTMRERALVILVRPFTLNFQEPIVLVLNIYSGLVYALLYIWFESFPIVFVGIYHFRPQLLGLSYLGILIGALAVAPTYLPYLKYVQGPMFSKEGFLKPEKRMPVAILGGCMIPVCLFWFGWTSRADVHWIVPIIGSSLFGYALLVVFNVIFNYLADAYPVYAASVLAGNNIVRSSFGAAFPLFVRAIYSRLGVGWATSLLAFFACAFVPIPVLLYYYGERIRLASKRARHDY